MNEKKWGWSVFVLIALIVVCGFFLPRPLGDLVKSPGGGLALTWLIVGILTFGIVGVAGLSLGKGLTGVLVDPAQNMMSLSRLQVVLWTVVVISAFVTVAVARVGDSLAHPDGYVCPAPQDPTEEPACADPLAIQLPALLWLLMGISITSSVGSPLLKANKAQRTAEEDNLREQRDRDNAATYGGVLENRGLIARGESRRLRGAARQDEPGGSISYTGALVRKASWRDARFSDVFMAEEVETFGYVDVAKLQNFFFTVISLVAYTTALAVAMVWAGSIAGFFAFPDVPPGLLAMISISHGGYLTDKAFTHSTPAVPPPDLVA